MSNSSKDEFAFVEIKRLAKRLRCDELIDAIRQSIDPLSTRGEYESEYASAYKLSQEILKADPNLPWSLTHPRVNAIKRAIYTTKNCIPIGEICELAQGVTPGGGCLDIYLISNKKAKNLEAKCLRPAVEADDIKVWVIKDVSKWLIYPYDDSGKKFSFGNLDLNISQKRAESEIDRLIVRGVIVFPKTATYLVSHFAQLSQRMFEKKTLSGYGKSWYEYHRPRNISLLCKSPKIVTRRMTKDVEFSLDLNGVLPTDGCIAMILRSKNAVVENLVSHGMKQEEAVENACYYLLSLLNSTILKFLLKSTADFWQGNYYQVREGFLSDIPVRIPNESCIEEIKGIVKLTKMVTHGRESKIEEIENLIFKLYTQESAKTEIQKFLATRT